jgi:predicted RNase H-like nuclease (RuvC/YqgF family)
MPPENDGANTPAVNEPKPPAGKPDNEPTPQAGGGDSPADEPLTLETKKKLDKENKQLRRERDEANTALQKLKDAELSETDRLKKQLQAIEDEKKAWARERQERDARDTVVAALTDDLDSNKYRAKNPSSARALFKLIKDDLEYDDKGEILNLSTVLNQAKKEYGDLFAGKAAGSADGGQGSRNGNQAFDMNSEIRRLAGRA